ncbi:glutamyl-tRNA reductase, partial [Streptomyces yangpuensis]
AREGPPAPARGRTGVRLWWVSSARGGRPSPLPWPALADELTRVDVVISCTGATGLVLTADDVLAAVSFGAGGLAPAEQGAAGSAPQAHQELRPRTPAPQSPAGPDVAGLDGQVLARLVAAAEAGARLADAGAARTISAPADTEADGCPVGLDGRSALAGVDAGSLELHGTWADQGEAAAQRQPRRSARTQAHAADVRLALLDLAMPRDIDAAVHRIPGVRLVDIESLAEASADAPMAADVDAVRGIVAQEVAAFGAAQRAAHITPTVVALRAMAAEVVAMEVARLDGRLPDLDERQRAEVTQTVRRVVDKLLHAPTVRVKQLASEPGGAGYADALRELFDLDPQTVASVSRADAADPKNDDDPGRAS